MDEKNYPPLIPEQSKDVLAKLTNSDPEHVELAVEICQQLFTFGQQRGRDVEQKASAMMGTAGVATVISIAIVSFLIAPARVLQGWPNFVVLALFVLLVLASSISVLLASKVMRVGVESMPGPLIIFEQQPSGAIEFRKAYAADLFVAFAENFATINKKVENLRLSQKAFVVFVSTLALTGVFIASVAIFVD